VFRAGTCGELVFMPGGTPSNRKGTPDGVADGIQSAVSGAGDETGLQNLPDEYSLRIHEVEPQAETVR
jgi:hypothetical protein